jgi:hypothetical protein
MVDCGNIQYVQFLKKLVKSVVLYVDGWIFTKDSLVSTLRLTDKEHVIT